MLLSADMPCIAVWLQVQCSHLLVCQAYTAAEATYARAGYAAWKPPAPDLLHWDSVDRSAVLMHKHLFPLDGACG